MSTSLKERTGAVMSAIVQKAYCKMTGRVTMTDKTAFTEEERKEGVR